MGPPADRGATAREALFAGGGEMGARMRAYDWSQTPLGPVEGWPQSLKTVVRIILTSRYAMWLGYGPELTFFCNDAYSPTVGVKLPWVLGSPAQTVWAEIWDDIGPRIERVMATGEATWDEALRLFLERSGYPEETYHTFSYSPVADDDGQVAGMLCVVTEETERTLGERRSRTLRDLSAQLVRAKTVDEVCYLAMDALGTNPYDVPWALLYRIEGRTATLMSAADIEPEAPGAPALVALDAAGADRSWPLAEVARQGDTLLVEGLGARFAALPVGPWGEPPDSALVLPVALPGHQRPELVLIAAVNRYRPLDDSYRAFFDLVASQIAAALADSLAYEEERRRAEALAELDRAKTAFFSNVSHEFRTPLTLMLGPLEDALANPTGLPTAEREQLAMVHRNGLRLLRLVNTLLDFSRIESGRTQAVYEPVDLATLTAELASVFRSAVERAGLRLVVECPPLPERVYVDQEMWEKIVLNLISNAFKYTPDGEIRVALRWATDHVELVVSDTGVGIPDGELPHVFERFHRVEGTYGRTHEGSGIGLALVQELVRLHGGSVDVTSRVGAGSTFTVCLPTGAAHLPAERLGGARPLAPPLAQAAPFVEEALRWLPPVVANGEAVPDAEGWPEDAALAGAPADAPRVLLADDNADMREYVRRLLAGQYRVETTDDGQAALAAARAERPDLVLTDVMMPRLDGFGLLRALRADPQTSTVPVIMLSARAGEEAYVEGLEAGADDYLVKPFSARELLARVNACLELARVRTEAARREQALRREADAAKDRVTDILERINDGFVALDHEWRYTYVNARVAARLGRSAASLLGKVIWDEYPVLLESGLAEQARRAVTEQVPVRFEHSVPGQERWSEITLYPTPDGVALFSHDITVRKQAERTREDFLAAAAHDLKTPLTTIKGLAQIHQRRVQRLNPPDAPQLVDGLVRIDGAANEMLRQINTLLDLTRQQAGEPLRLDRSAVDLTTLAQQEVVRRQAASDLHRLRVAAPATPIVGQWDGDRIGRVVTNLLTNAIKYSPEGGEITVRLVQEATADGDWAVLSVTDDGVGIPATDLARVFDRFYRGSNVVGKIDGTGIGLAAVRQIVEQHGGTIRVDSQEGAGATFTVRLPLMAAATVDGATPGASEA